VRKLPLHICIQTKEMIISRMTIHHYLTSLVLDLSDIDESDVAFDASFEKLGLDSLAFVEMQVGIAKRYGVKITPDLFMSGKLKNLEDIADYITEKRSAASGNAEAAAVPVP
jgi:acyl carrier protein